MAARSRRLSLSVPQKSQADKEAAIHATFHPVAANLKMCASPLKSRCFP